MAHYGSNNSLGFGNVFGGIRPGRPQHSGYTPFGSGGAPLVYNSNDGVFAPPARRISEMSYVSQPDHLEDNPRYPGQQQNNPGYPGLQGDSHVIPEHEEYLGHPGQQQDNPGYPGQQQHNPGYPGQQQNNPGYPDLQGDSHVIPEQEEYLGHPGQQEYPGYPDHQEYPGDQAQYSYVGQDPPPEGSISRSRVKSIFPPRTRKESVDTLDSEYSAAPELPARNYRNFPDPLIDVDYERQGSYDNNGFSLGDLVAGHAPHRFTNHSFHGSTTKDMDMEGMSAKKRGLSFQSAAQRVVQNVKVANAFRPAGFRHRLARVDFDAVRDLVGEEKFQQLQTEHLLRTGDYDEDDYEDMISGGWEKMPSEKRETLLPGERLTHHQSQRKTAKKVWAKDVTEARWVLKRVYGEMFEFFIIGFFGTTAAPKTLY